jgi:DNA-binding Lrp family transcriptional regulator
MEHEAVHAFAAGYEGTRAVRTWQERMKVLEQAGFIKTVEVGNQKYKYVAIVHPTTAIQQLRDAKKISDKWWNAYVALKVQTREGKHEQREKKIASARKVVSMLPPVTKPTPKARSK